ncbi:aminotransferase class III-fold pyridoxal phosphate-dependent enzyme [Staphylococcus aureus]|nr:aminotransferase class III-fold pyridoxal phosphate-dependent enzyme [Staphylococcus aureus]
MTKSEKIIELTNHYGAHNYLPLPIVISEAEGVWVKDPEGNKYMDMLSAYSAVNQGHRHPKIIQALKDQADKVTLVSRAFHSDNLGEWYEKICKAEIIAFNGNFHGRTMAPVSLSSEAEYQRGYGPLLDGFRKVDFGDVDALKAAINENTAAVLVEPIQGEAGINIPPEGYLKAIRELCDEHNVLFIADEIQAGLGRSGKLFATDWDNVKPDVYILGKALGGGVFPISVVLADKEVLDVFTPGSHGSTFGGNPLACAASIAALDVIVDEDLPGRSLELGDYFKEQLKQIDHPSIKEVRGRGLFIGVELNESARPYCEALKEEGLLCKETHDTVIRFAPPLIITKEELDLALEKIRHVFQ